MITARTRIRTLASRAHRTWSELDYAQRRLFELRTGLEVTDPRSTPRPGSIAELERLYRADQRPSRAEQPQQRAA
jgi:hypothetical protein